MDRKYSARFIFDVFAFLLTSLYCFSVNLTDTFLVNVSGVFIIDVFNYTAKIIKKLDVTK